ncbi:MAG: LLM class flavin-dependent oxidoreductase [Thermomicrobiaceae bacterium]|nr:LLM class flavin-dependent oxidoreductase [Thermomicrobiaceae bacterium]
MPQSRVAVGLHLPPKPPGASLRAIALGARLLRLDSLMIWDHLQDLFPRALWDRRFTWLASGSPSPHAFFEFQVTLGYLAAQAGRLQLGVAVTEPIRRHPVVIAQAMLTLAHLTKRPPVLGIGSGERENVEPYGLDFSQPVGRLEEALQILRRAFSGPGPIDFEGRFFQLHRAPLDLQAPRGRAPRIWVAAHGPRMLRLTGQYGDGWYPVDAFVPTPEEYAAKLAVVREAARAAGRDPDAITPAFQPHVVLAPTEAEARAMLDTRVVRFTGLMAPAEAWRRAGHRHPFGDEFRGFIDFVPERYDRKVLDEALAAVPIEAVAERLIWGTPEQVARRLRGFADAGMRHVVVEVVSAMISRRAALYGLRALRAIARELNAGR